VAAPEPESQGTRLPPRRGPDHAGGAAGTPRDVRPTEAEVRAPPPLTVDTSTAPTADVRPAGWPCATGYDVLGVLGRGGMGVVYKARHLRLGRLVALKMIRDGILAGPEQAARFQLEAAAVARLRHPNIVQIYEIGEADGRPYLSLELVEGGNLAQRLSGTPLPTAMAAGLTETLARAVHHAHEAGIVHRDLKPANVLLTADGTPKVTDFGVAKHLEAEVFLTHTPSGVLLGTPSYMAPEQAWGKPREVGPCSDVYALGAILYELVTGQPPFLGERLLETLERVRSQEPVPPRRLQPKVPRDLETVCLKCLHKDPQRRYGSALALAEDLRRFRAGEPIHARRTPAWERALKWVRRRPAAAALVGVSTLAAVLLAMLIRGAGSSLLPAAPGPAPAVSGGARTVPAVTAPPARSPAAPAAAPPAQDEALALYAVRLAAADRARAAGDRAGAERALENCAPALRGWEWHYLRRRLHSAPGTPVLRSHQGGATGLAFSPRGTRLASGGLDQTVQVWDAAAGKGLTLRGHDHAVLGLAFHPEGTLLAAVEGTGWRGPPDMRVPSPMPADGRAALPPRLLAAAGGPLLAREDRSVRPKPPENAPAAHQGGAPAAGRVIVWDAVAGKQARALPGPGRALTCVAYSPDGKWLVAGPGVEVIAPGHPVEPPPAPGEGRHPGGRDSLARRAGPEVFAPLLVLMRPVAAAAPQARPEPPGPGPESSAIQVWDAGTGNRVGSLRGHTGAVAAVAFDPSSTRLASAGSDGLLLLWDMTRRQDRPVSLAGHQGALLAVAFSPDGKRLASAGADGTVRLWDAQAGREVLTLREHGDAVGCLAFSPDGKRLFSGGWDHTLRVWDAAGGVLLLTLRTPATPTGVALAPGGDVLGAAASDGAVRFWDGTPPDKPASPFARLPREADAPRGPAEAPAPAVPPGDAAPPKPPGPDAAPAPRRPTAPEPQRRTEDRPRQKKKQ
jgi:WD40 repeat protein